MAALSAWHAPHTQVVIVGDASERRPLEAELADHYRPFAITLSLGPDAQAALADRLPFVAPTAARAGAAAYVCRDFICRQPVATPQALAAELTS